MNREDLSFLEGMFSKPLDSITENILIIHQSKTSELTSSIENIRVINDNRFGLSRSRNLALRESQKEILWLMDDDCIIYGNATEKITEAHSAQGLAVITFRTLSPAGRHLRSYKSAVVSLSRKQIKKVLSPEITLKRSAVLKNNLTFDERFGLGASFQDSENYLFLLDAMDQGIDVLFVPETVVSHDALTSSDEAATDRVVYARGALAAHRNSSTAWFYQCKYTFFLWRKGFAASFKELRYKYRLFGQGMKDYLSGLNKARGDY